MAKKKNKRRGKKDAALNTAALPSQDVVADIKATTDEEKDKAKDNNSNIASSKETAKKENVVGNDVFYSTKSETTPAEGDEGYNEFLSLLKDELEDTIITAVSKDEGDDVKEEEDGPNYLPKGLVSTEGAEGSTSTIEDLSPMMVASRDSESSFIGDVDLNKSNDSENANLLPPLPDIQVVDEKGLVDGDEKKDQEGGLAQKIDNKEKLEDGLRAETATKEIVHGEEGEWVVVEDLPSIPSGEDTGESSDQAVRETVVNDSEKIVDKKKEDTWGKLAKKIAARACCLKSVRSNTNAI